MHLTAHFTLHEMTRTSTHLPNRPKLVHVANLTRLCILVLEPLREILGPLRVNSGFRSPAVNALVGGHPRSAHLDGRAADVVPLRAGVGCRDLMRALDEGSSSIPFDKAIHEVRGSAEWVHVQVRNVLREPRRLLLSSPSEGSYEPWEEAS